MTCLHAGPFVLVGGAPRSGTSLLASVIGSHPDAAVLPEENMTAVVRALQRLAAVRVEAEDETRKRLVGHAGSLLVEGDGDALAQLSQLESFRRRFGTLLATLFCTASGRSLPKVLGSKMVVSAFWEDLDLLGAVFADLRLVFILRNPMDVLSSSLARTRAALRGEDRWRAEGVAVTYRRWLGAMRIMAAAAAGPRRVLLIKYEDLSAHPQEEERRVLAFAGLDPPVARAALSLDLDRASLRGLCDADREELDRLLGPIDAVWRDSTPSELLERFGAAAPFLATGEVVELGHDVADPFLASGFCGPEGWGRWTDGPHSHLRLRHAVPYGRDLHLRFGVAHALAREGTGGMPLGVAVNGGPPQAAVARAGKALEVRIPASRLRADGLLEIALDILAPKARTEPPRDDPRALGVAFSDLLLTWAL